MEEQSQNQINELNNQILQKQTEINNLNNSFFSEKTNLQNQINNISLQLQQKQGELDQTRNSFDNERNTLQSQIDNFNTQKQSEITSLQDSFNQERTNLNSEISRLNTEISKLNSQIQSNQVSFETQIRNLNTQLETKSNEIQKLNNQVNENVKDVIENLAKYYKDYSNTDLKTEKDRWYENVKLGFIFVGGLTFILVLLFFLDKTLFQIEISLSKKIATFALDIVTASWLWFCVNQYSYYKKLLTDYQNRSVVASSYVGVLNNTNDMSIKNEATRVIADTLFSRSGVESGNELPLKELIKVADNLTSRSK